MLEKAITLPLRVTMHVMFSLKNLRQSSEDDVWLWLDDEYEAD